LSSSILAIQSPYDSQVLSQVEVVIHAKYILTAPATQTMKPTPNNKQIMNCCRPGIFRETSVGIGRKKTRKSVIVLMIPPNKRWRRSSMHFCGVKDNVQ
jgi:hypothetical protein